MSLREKLVKSDYKIYAIAAVGIGLCAYFLFFDSGKHSGSEDDSAELGQVAYIQNDARQKAKGSYVWSPVKGEQKVFLGDSIYSGDKSRVQVVLNSGSDVSIGENSLVTFGQMENQKMLDLRLGEVSLKVDGTLKIAVKGKVTTVTGTKSEIKVEIGKDKVSRVKLVQGEAQVSHKDTPEVKLEIEKEMTLPEPEVQAHVTVNDLPPLAVVPAGVEPAPLAEVAAPGAPAVAPPTTTLPGQDPALNPPGITDGKVDPAAPTMPPGVTTEAALPPGAAPTELPPVTAEAPGLAPAPTMEAQVPTPPTVETKTEPPVQNTPEPVVQNIPEPVVQNVEERKPEPVQIPAPKLVAAENLDYTWKLHDLFVQSESSIAERKPRPTMVSAESSLSWKTDQAGPFHIQISNGPDFDNDGQLKKYESDTNETVLTKAFLGKTFWRVSTDKKNWSKPSSFNVAVHTLRGAEPRFEESLVKVPLMGTAISVNLPLKAQVEAFGYVVQNSTDPTFASSKTKNMWMKTAEINATYSQATVQYYRFRVVNKEQEISDWSKVAKVVVFAPVVPLAPKLAESKLKGLVGENFDLKFNSSAATTWLEIFDDNNQKIKTEKGTSLSFKPEQPGKYRARAFSVNDYGQVGPASEPAEIEVLPNFAANDKNANRKTASIDSSNTLKNALDTSETKNGNYNSGRLSAQGMIWALQSTEQKANATGTPVTTGFSVNGMYWLGKHGVEASYKTGLKAVTSAGADSENIQDLEARYHYRFTTSFPFGFAKELEMSYLLGFEHFYNATTGASNTYDIAKLGVTMKFPIAKKWMGGGEFVFGSGFEQSKKYEISGYFNYFYQPEWSVGAGYRLHLFEAGSAKSTPTGILPYREGYSEGFSGLNYHF